MSPQNEAIENVPSKNIYGTRVFCYLRFIRNTVRGRFTVQGLIKVKGERKEGGKKTRRSATAFTQTLLRNTELRHSGNNETRNGGKSKREFRHRPPAARRLLQRRPRATSDALSVKLFSQGSAINPTASFVTPKTIFIFADATNEITSLLGNQRKSVGNHACTYVYVDLCMYACTYVCMNIIKKTCTNEFMYIYAQV